MTVYCRVEVWEVSGRRWDVSERRWDVSGGRWDVSGRRWDVSERRWDVSGRHAERMEYKNMAGKRDGIHVEGRVEGLRISGG